jgi:hypothetical protein
MQVGVDQDYLIQFTHSHRIHAGSNGLAVNIVTFFKSKQAFWYSFIERLYELHSIVEVSDTTATQNILKLTEPKVI